MPKKTKKYGDFKDSNNEYVQLIPYFEFFIETYSESSKRRVFTKLVDFALYCKKNYNKKIFEIDPKEVLSYFKTIDKKKIRKNTKVLYRVFLNAYFNYVKKFKKDMEYDDSFRNPVPSPEIWDFTGSTRTIYDLEMNYQPLTLPIIKRILNHIYYVVEDVRVFPAISLIIYSGARISEICHIELTFLDLNNRWFITKIKSRKSERNGIYFFPQFFVSELKNYIKELKKKYKTPKYLFQSKTSYISPRTLQKHLKNAKDSLGLKCHANPHAFRDFLNTKRADMGLRTPYLEFLLNQTVNAVNSSSYMKSYKNKIKLRNLYDSYNPFKKILKPDPKL